MMIEVVQRRLRYMMMIVYCYHDNDDDEIDDDIDGNDDDDGDVDDDTDDDDDDGNLKAGETLLPSGDEALVEFQEMRQQLSQLLLLHWLEQADDHCDYEED